MGFVALHLEKAKGSDSGMSAHIERTIAPKNADEERTHLNREFIEFPEGVENRTQAIQHRLDTAGLTRKIANNQVRAIRVLMSGTHEDMARIESEGRLDEWCDDSLNWLNHTFGKDNVVSAVLHLDEKTPHIHATVIPIVTTERKRRKREEGVKKTYRKKKPSARLCCDEVMSRKSLEQYQDDYAIAMAKYGLKRGRRGSEARHKSTSDYYKELQGQSESLQSDISQLLEQQEAAQKELSATKSDISKEKLKNSAADVGSKLLDGASSLLGTPKVKRLEAENEQLREQNVDLKESHREEIAQLKTEFKRSNQQLYDQYQAQQREFSKREERLEQDKSRLQTTLDKIFKLYPKVAEMLRMESLCKAIGFTGELLKRLLKMEKVTFDGVVTSPESRYTYSVKGSTAQITPSPTPTDPDKLTLKIDNKDHTDWFDEQQHRRMYPHEYRNEPQSRGVRM